LFFVVQEFDFFYTDAFLI